MYKIKFDHRQNWLGYLADQFGIAQEGNMLSLPKSLGRGVLYEFEVDEGLNVAFGEMELDDQAEFISKPTKSKLSMTIMFQYIQRGHAFFKPGNEDSKKVKSGGVHFFSSNASNHLIYPANTHSFLFRAQMSTQWIRDNLSEFVVQNDSFNDLIFGKNKVMHFEPLTNRFVRLFKDVFMSEFDELLLHLIVKDKGYEAVVLFFDHFYKQFYHQKINSSKYSIDDQKRLYALTDFIQVNLDKNISLDTLTREVGFSKSKLQSMFRYFFHQSIYGYIKNLKFEKANKLLVSTDEDIRQIARSLGYNSSTHFINIFKKHMGISPKQYRIKNRMKLS